MTEPPADPPSERGLRWQQAKITAIVPQTPRVKSFFFELTRPFSFRAGQHVDVRLTAPDGYRAERSYSIASAPEPQRPLELAIERLDDGEVSPFFHDVAAVGDDIELRGPIGGHFVWDVADGGPLLLLGGGSGVVPLMSMIRDRASQSSPRADAAAVLGAEPSTTFCFAMSCWRSMRVMTVSSSRLRSPADRHNERATTGDGSTP